MTEETPPTQDGPSRRRSRSPRRQEDNRERNRDRRDKPRSTGGGGGGFKWKDKRRDNPDKNDRDNRDKSYQRGYRNRSRSPRRDRDREREREQPKRSSGGGGGGSSVEDKFGIADKFGPSKTMSTEEPSTSTSSAKDEQPPKRAAPDPVATHGEPMIIVHVNDRLGTKAAIPCLASDPIKLFKAQVAARIGRRPHEILLKRQGERPFKDQLTLEDYGISNGVQIDLEIDTGE